MQMVGRTIRMGSDPAYWNVQPVVLDGGASTMIHGSIESRAAVIDYLQKLERGEVSKETLSERAEKSADGEYSPWRKVKRSEEHTSEHKSLPRIPSHDYSSKKKK